MQVKESDIEDWFLQKLQDLKYRVRDDIHDKAALTANFRAKFEALNRVQLTDAEFERLLADIITPDVFAAAQRLREPGYMQREDGTPLHYDLVNRDDWCKNDYEAIHQLRINTDNSHQRYDVILLVNGLPLVQVELKTLGVSPQRAMEQIVRYKSDPGNGYGNSLLCFMQLFMVSNQYSTWYFANNRREHFAFDADARFLPVYQWANPDNSKVTHLHEVADQLLAKCDLGRLISRYLVLMQSMHQILIMRPYQIYAVKAIMDCIHENRGNGYIWHTTGSGKTLTSFKASTLLKDNPDIAKCLFVVDRKDLDRQTREEFNKFQPGCVEQNTNTEALVRRLLSTDYADKVIVTTIQKLGLALDENSRRNQQHRRHGRATYKQRLEPLADKRVVFIFDECHRSQFGDNHQAIKDFFPRAQLFGFTGTPIFDDNATQKQVDGTDATWKTTADIFQKQLHAYTITHAIEDRNVLRFHVDYFKPEVAAADTQAQKPQHKPGKPDDSARRRAVAEAILTKHARATDDRRFNALLATGSINEAIAYWQDFQALQDERAAQDPQYARLNIACVFSPPAEGNKDTQQLQEDLPQEKADNQHQPGEKKRALTQIIAAYNAQYGTNFNLGTFDLYYQDVQSRIKQQQYPNSDWPQKNKIDLTIVVDMLLTGFDSKYLNTLYVDKKLRWHGLIQAFSRTNRVLNDTKPWGNILDFRGQEKAVDEAIQLFSGADAQRSREIWLADDAPKVIAQYTEAVSALQGFMDAQGLPCTPDAVANLKGDAARASFINHFKDVQRLKKELDQYTSLTPEQQAGIDAALSESTLRGFKGMYLETAQQLKAQQGRHGDDASPDQAAVDQLDFELVLFSSALIDYDYIMGLIARYTSEAPTQDTMTRAQLVDLLASSSNLMGERDDIAAFVATLQPGQGMSEDDVRQDYERFKAAQDERAVADLARKHQIEPATLQGFVDAILQRMIFDGEQLGDLLAPRNLGWRDRARAELALMDDLAPLLRKRAQGREISGLAAYE